MRKKRKELRGGYSPRQILLTTEMSCLLSQQALSGLNEEGSQAGKIQALIAGFKAGTKVLREALKTSSQAV